jgi:hypothetical protein
VDRFNMDHIHYLSLALILVGVNSGYSSTRLEKH